MSAEVNKWSQVPMMRSWGALPSSSFVLLLVLKPDRTQFSRTRDHAENEHNSAYLFRHRIPAARSRMRTNARVRALKSVDLHCEEGNLSPDRPFMLTTVQPSAFASSQALSSLPISDWRSFPLGVVVMDDAGERLAIASGRPLPPV
jgi:hypothetical protein